MPIPCGPGEHWRVLEVLVPFEAAAFDPDAFAAALGLERSLTPFVVTDDAHAESHTHGRLAQKSEVAEELDAAEGPEWMLRLLSYRVPLDHEGGQEVVIGHEALLLAIEASFSWDELFLFAVVTLAFPSDVAEWRTSLLAEPPELNEFKEDLGSIQLAGLTLRFRDSSPGLHEARLEVSGDGEDEYTTELQFSLAVPRSEISQLYQTVLEKAERFASLFLSVR